ncbi:hypothetical protein HN51_042367 [Arachis hypogaea]
MTFRYPFVCMIIEPVFPVNASPNVPTHLSLFGTMPSSLNSTLLSITSIWRSPLFSSTWEPSALTLLSPAINMINNQFRDLKSKFPRPQSDESSTFSVDLFLLQMIDVHLDLLNCLIEMMQAFSAYDPSDVTEQFLLGYCKAYSMLQGLCEAPPCLDLLSEHKWGFLPQSEGNAIKTRVTLFEMHQALKLHQGAISELSQYNPLDLFSGSKERIHKATNDLFITPQNNFHTRRTRRWHKENRFAHGSSI